LSRGLVASREREYETTFYLDKVREEQSYTKDQIDEALNQVVALK